MGRLTDRDKHEQGIWVDEQNGLYDFHKLVEPSDVLYPALNKLAHYEDMEELGLLTIIDNETFQRDESDRCTHRSCNNCDKYRRELQKYKDLEEAGRLIELPCAVGDTVYEVVPLPMLFDELKQGYAILEKEFGFNDLKDFDEWVFLTKEEAEAKLKELEGDKE